MPVVRDIVINLNIDQVLRHQGITDNRKANPHILEVLQSVVEEINITGLLKPAIAYEIYQVTGIDNTRISLSNGKSIHSKLISFKISKIKETAVIICTIGPGLEEKASQLFRNGKPLRGLLMDGTGNAAVDLLAEEACRIVGEQSSGSGLQSSSPISPGMRGFPISEQINLVSMTPADEIGVSLTSVNEMVPRKSLSMVIGIGPEMKRYSKAEACARCSLGKTCRYRVEAVR